MIRFFSIVVLFFAALPAWAQHCSCDMAIPIAGQYRITGPTFSDVLTLEVGLGEDGECGGAIAITSPPGVFLTCEGDKYRGIIPKSPDGRPEQEMVIFPNQIISGGFTIATSFSGLIQRPSLISFVPGEPLVPSFTMELIAPSGARAPDCMCKSVKGWLDTALDAHSMYSDQGMIDEALELQMAGIAPHEYAWPDGTDGTRYRTNQYITSYQSRVTSRVSADDEIYDDGAPQRDVVADAAGAATNPDNCEVSDASPYTDSGQCRPGVVLSAIRAHEDVHSNRCLALIDLEQEPMAYRRWSNHPPNHALDEREAYQVVLDILEPWYEQSCN